MCKCGCNSCDIKTTPPILNENIVSKEILSEGLKYHIKNKIPLTKNIHKPGTKSYFNLWSEARYLYSRGIIDVLGEDLRILTKTHLGNFGIYEGKNIPLNFPINEGDTIFQYVRDNKDKSIKKIFTESTNNNTYKIRCKVVTDTTERPMKDIMSDIRAVEGITTIDTISTDQNSINSYRHVVKLSIKIDPSPFTPFSTESYIEVLNKIKLIPGILTAAYLNTPEIV